MNIAAEQTAKSRAKSFVKLLIAVAVVVALAMATKQAIRQWNDQIVFAEENVQQLNLRIERSSSISEKEDLVEKRDQAIAKIPSLFNLRWTLIVAAGLVYSAGLAPGALVFQSALRCLGYRLNFDDVFAAQIEGHLGKYVPGKAMVVVIRAGRLHRTGLPLAIGSVGVFMETISMMAVGAAIGGCLVFFLPVPSWIAFAGFGAGVVAMVPTVPFILKHVVKRIGKVDADPSWDFFFTAWCWQLTAWVLIGSAFTLLVMSLPGVDFGAVATSTVFAASTAAISLAMVVGFASLLPGGAGVRELTLTLILTPVVGVSQALLAAILARLVFIAVELMAAALIRLYKAKLPKPDLISRVSP